LIWFDLIDWLIDWSISLVFNFKCGLIILAIDLFGTESSNRDSNKQNGAKGPKLLYGWLMFFFQGSC
jgi:hypothetical protein